MLIDEDDDTPISKLLLAHKSKNGKEAADDKDSSDDDSSDDDSVTETLLSPTQKKHPAVAKLARGRQHKPFSPSGKHTAIILLIPYLINQTINYRIYLPVLAVCLYVCPHREFWA